MPEARAVWVEHYSPEQARVVWSSWDVTRQYNLGQGCCWLSQHRAHKQAWGIISKTIHIFIKALLNALLKRKIKRHTEAVNCLVRKDVWELQQIMMQILSWIRSESVFACKNWFMIWRIIFKWQIHSGVEQGTPAVNDLEDVGKS